MLHLEFIEYLGGFLPHTWFLYLVTFLGDGNREEWKRITLEDLEILGNRKLGRGVTERVRLSMSTSNLNSEL